MAVAALTLTTNCSKVEEVIDEEKPVEEQITPQKPSFTLVTKASNEGETKTTNDDVSTKWAATDVINVFHAEASTTSYVSDDDFTTNADDMASGIFKGTLGEELASGKSYDWYVVYPYKAGLSTPANTSTYYYFGGPSNVVQEQDGNSNMSHLAGEYYALYGKASNVAYDTTPDVDLINLASIVEVKVTNNSTAAFTVEDVTFTAPSGVAIVGQFIPNFTASPITYTEGTYTTETASLSVVDADPIAVDGTATFYLGIKPFAATSGQSLKVSINGHEKTINLTKDITFQSGKIKTINFNYNYAPEVYELVTAIGAISDGEKYVFALQDGVTTSTYYFLNNAGSSDNLDTELTVSTNTITNPVKKYVFTAEAASTLFKFLDCNGKYIYNNGSKTDLITNNGTATSWLVTAIDGGYFKFNKDNSSGRFWGAKGATPTAAGGYATSNYKNQHADTPTAIAQGSGAWSVFKLGGYTPPVGIDDATVEGEPARGGSGRTKNIVLHNYATAPDLTVTPDGNYVTAATVGSITTTGATVTYTLAPNYTSSAKAGSITVSDGNGHSATVIVNQVAARWENTASNPLVIGNTSGATKNCTIYSDFDWTISTTNLSGASVNLTSFTYTDHQNQAITFTTTGANTSAEPVSLGYITITRTDDGAEMVINLQQQATASGETLPFNWDGGKSDGTVNMTIAAGSNYSSAPKVKFQNKDSHYITVRIASAASSMSFLAKQNGTSNDSVITLAGSVDGSSFTSIETFDIKPGNGKTQTYTSKNSIDATYRYLRIMLTNKGTDTNIGVGSLHIE